MSFLPSLSYVILPFNFLYHSPRRQERRRSYRPGRGSDECWDECFCDDPTGGSHGEKEDGGWVQSCSEPKSLFLIKNSEMRNKEIVNDDLASPSPSSPSLSFSSPQDVQEAYSTCERSIQGGLPSRAFLHQRRSFLINRSSNKRRRGGGRA